MTVTAPGSATAPIAVYGLNGYGGTITFTPKADGYPNTGTPGTKKALPAGVTVSVSPASVTIAPGDTTPHSATVTLTAAAGYTQYDDYFKVSAADALSTISTTALLVVNGDVVSYPENYLTISPTAANPAPSSPGSSVVQFTLANSGTDPFDVTMLASTSNTAIAIEFGNFASATATSTASTMTFALPNTAGIQWPGRPDPQLVRLRAERLQPHRRRDHRER